MKKKKNILAFVVMIIVGVILYVWGESYPYEAFNTLSLNCQLRSSGAMIVLLSPIALIVR